MDTHHGLSTQFVREDEALKSGGFERRAASSQDRDKTESVEHKRLPFAFEDNDDFVGVGYDFGVPHAIPGVLRL